MGLTLKKQLFNKMSQNVLKLAQYIWKEFESVLYLRRFGDVGMNCES